MLDSVGLGGFQKNSSTYFLKYAVSFLVGSVVTFLVLYLGVIRNFTQKRQVTLVERLAVSPDLLSTPIVYEWRGSVIGKVIGKDDHTFTLEDDNGNQLRITDIQPNGRVFKTVFLDVDVLEEGRAKEITLRDIPIGTTLRGEFWVFNTGRNTPVGSMFKIVRK